MVKAWGWRGAHGAALGGDAEGGVGRAIALVGAATFDDLEEQSLSEHLAAKLEELAAFVAIVEESDEAKAALAKALELRPGTTALNVAPPVQNTSRFI